MSRRVGRRGLGAVARARRRGQGPRGRTEPDPDPGIAPGASGGVGRHRRNRHARRDRRQRYAHDRRVGHATPGRACARRRVGQRAARRGAAVDRASSDTQPGHGRWQRRPRRPGRRAARGHAGPRRADDDPRRRRHSHRRGDRLLPFVSGDRDRARRAARRRACADRRRSVRVPRSKRSAGAMATSRSPARQRKSSSTPTAESAPPASRSVASPSTPVRRRCGDARARSDGRSTRRRSTKSRRLAAADLDPPSTSTRPACVPQTHRRRAGVTNIDRCQLTRSGQRRGPRTAIRAGSPASETASCRVDGQRAAADALDRIAHDTGRLPPRGTRAHRHASRLRAWRVRRVHGAARRRGQFVRASCSPYRRRSRRGDHRGPRRHRQPRPVVLHPLQQAFYEASASSAASDTGLLDVVAGVLA